MSRPATKQSPSLSLASRLHDRMIALTDPDTPARFTRTGWTIIAVLIVLLLLPTLLLPLGPDQALFLVAGEGILQGDVPYRDLIDIKPPIIYYLYGSAAALFGHGGVSIRILDVILQCLGCLMLIKLVRRATGNDLAATIASFVYLTTYLAVGYASLAQTESYVVLLASGAFWFLLYRRTTAGLIAVGMLVGVLFFLKFTLGILLAVVLLGEMTLFQQKPRAWLGHTALIATGFAAIAGGIVLFMAAIGSLEPFLVVLQFTRGYAQSEWASMSQWIKNACTLLPHHLAINFSMVFSVSAVVGIVISMTPWKEVTPQRLDTIRLLRLSTVAFLFMAGTILIEAKYHVTHISRLYPFGAILAAVGIVAAVRYFTTHGVFGRGTLYSKALLTFFAFSLLFYSPIPGYSWKTAAVGWKNLKRQMGSADTESSLVQDSFFEEADSIAQYIIPRRANAERMMAVSGVAGLMYHTCNYIPDFPLLHSAFVIGYFSPPSWREMTRLYVVRKQPRFILLQNNDSLPSLTGSTLNSTSAFRSINGLDSILSNDYTEVCHTRTHDLYERRTRKPDVIQ